MNGKGFGDLRFGYSDAYTEAVREPDLLLRGFYDPMGLEAKMLHGHQFLVLGPKGSGKSAFAVRLSLMASSDLLVSSRMLGDFPFDDFASIQAGGVTKEARYPAAWRWLLCLALLASFENDEAAIFDDIRPFRQSLKTLREEGWLPADSLRTLIIDNTRTSTVNLSLPILGGSEEIVSSRRGIPFPAAIDTLARLVARFRSPTTHILVIDGLDDLIIHNADDIQWDVLSALVVAAQRLNEDLFSWDIEAKILVLCRTDIFEHLPGANTNKYRRDSAVDLNWYQDIKNPAASNLVALANRKASVLAPELPNAIGRFLPHRITLEAGASFETVPYLLDYTRHTPRDFLQLLESIGAACTSARVAGQVPSSVIEAGVHNYCEEYFVGELRNELDGLLTAQEIDLTKRLLRGLRRHRFYFHELERKVDSSTQYAGLPLQKVIARLFDSGIVGNLVGGRDRSVAYVRFKYRNPYQEPDYDMQLVLHNAAINGFNVPRGVSGKL